MDDFECKYPDGFAPDDFRRTGNSSHRLTIVLTIRLNSVIAVPKFQGENFYKIKAIVDEIKKLATQKECTVAEIALAWVAAQGLISIPSTTKASRLEENWRSRDIALKAMRKMVDDAKPVVERFSAIFQSMVGHWIYTLLTAVAVL